jgi:hypothetical protein
MITVSTGTESKPLVGALQSITEFDRFVRIIEHVQLFGL